MLYLRAESYAVLKSAIIRMGATFRVFPLVTSRSYRRSLPANSQEVIGCVGGYYALSIPVTTPHATVLLANVRLRRL